MLFGKNGYIGPDGKRKVSMKQYYEKQSGGSYTISGTVAGWYTAKHEAAYYGGNVPDESGSDGKPRELVKEALEAAAKTRTLISVNMINGTAMIWMETAFITNQTASLTI